MIDEQETRLQFGYYSESLSHGSRKKVYGVCDECGYTRIIQFNDYVKTKGRCKSCAHYGENNSMFGKHPTEETKDKMSKNTTGENNPMFGKHHTEEAKQKMLQNRVYNFGENHYNWRGGAKMSTARASTKRRELFGFIPHNKTQENFHGHHLDFNHVIFIPAELHKSIWHSVTKDINMEEINDAVCDWYLNSQGV